MKNDHEVFVKALAQFLVADQAKKSMQLALGVEVGHQWRDLRMTTPLAGYPTVQEAEKQLAEWLWPVASKVL